MGYLPVKINFVISDKLVRRLAERQVSRDRMAKDGRLPPCRWNCCLSITGSISISYVTISMIVTAMFVLV